MSNKQTKQEQIKHKTNCVHVQSSRRGTSSACSYLRGTPQRLRQPAARLEELNEVIDDQLSLLVVPHHGHEDLRRRRVDSRDQDASIETEIRQNMWSDIN